MERAGLDRSPCSRVLQFRQFIFSRHKLRGKILISDRISGQPGTHKFEYVQKHSQVTDKSPIETATKQDGFKAKTRHSASA